MSIPLENKVKKIEKYFQNDLNGLVDFIEYLDLFHRGWRKTSYRYFENLKKISEKYFHLIV